MGGTRKPSSRAILAMNLAALMKSRGWSAREVSRRTNGEIAPKTVSNILRQEKTPTSDTLDAVAGAFGLETWMLCLPHLAADLESPPSLAELYKSYTAASQEGREMIQRVAEREATYNEPK